jgi:TfoX/Sxy family transcriptional regulator of competence genes
MAVDAELAEKIRDLLTGSRDVTEQKMFGGLAFLIGGNLALACSHRGLLVRVGPNEAADVIARSNGELAVMGSRTMKGWVRVPPGDELVEQLADWVELGAGYARSLPAKG